MASTTHTNFYKRMSILLIALLFAGFTPFVYMRLQTGGTLGTALVFHTLIFLFWFILFFIQSSLISAKNTNLHQKLGKLSLVVALALVTSAILVTNNAYDAGSNGGTPFSHAHFIILPTMDILLFTGFYALGFVNRRNGNTHKHYMLFAGIIMMDPALARLGMTLGAAPLALLLHFALIAAVMVYDRKTAGRIHLVTKTAAILIVIRIILLFAFGPTETWQNIAHFLYG